MVSNQDGNYEPLQCDKEYKVLPVIIYLKKVEMVAIYL